MFIPKGQTTRLAVQGWTTNTGGSPGNRSIWRLSDNHRPENCSCVPVPPNDPNPTHIDVTVSAGIADGAYRACTFDYWSMRGNTGPYADFEIGSPPPPPPEEPLPHDWYFIPDPRKDPPPRILPPDTANSKSTGKGSGSTHNGGTHEGVPPIKPPPRPRYTPGKWKCRTHGEEIKGHKDNPPAA